MSKKRWYQPGERLNWHKDEAVSTRRRKALKSRHRDKLSTARALQALSNVTKDKGTKSKAHTDARFFYNQYKKKR